jgi:hypothetical protein
MRWMIEVGWGVSHICGELTGAPVTRRRACRDGRSTCDLVYAVEPLEVVFKEDAPSARAGVFLASWACRRRRRHAA